MREPRFKKLRAIAKSLQNGSALGAACEAAQLNRITLWKWRKQDERLNIFIKILLEHQIQVVEDALFRRACGYRYEEITKEREESTLEKRTAKVVTKEVAPDSTACMFYLMNRAPERWADKRALVNNTNIIKNIINPLGKLADEELNGIIAGFSRKPGFVPTGTIA
jgi:hypothetical protein